jgi:hypothetical protein
MIAKALVVVLALCVAGALAQDHYCCTTNQWTADARGVARAHGQVANATELFYEVVYYDFDNHRMRFDVFADLLGIDRHIERTIIEKMVKGRWERFVIFPDGKCERHDPKIAFMEQACVRGDYVHKWEYTIGEILGVEAFLHEPRREVFVETSVAKHTCIPIHGHFSARHRMERVSSNVLWTNFRPHIEDPAVFNLPSSCNV